MAWDPADGQQADARRSLAGRPKVAALRSLGVLSGVALVAFAVSSWNPLLAAGANNRLESRCPRSNVSCEYDRSVWTPLLWSCTSVDLDGRTSRTRAFP